MNNVQILVACMNQKDDSLYKEMNLQTDVILANQCDEHSCREFTQPDGNTVKLISSADRGVGKNRNKALLYATGKYVICADQDMIFVDGYAQKINEAFCKFPKADMIIFGLEYMNRFTPGKKRTAKHKKLHIWNSMRYGTACAAIRLGAIEKKCLSFSTLYGGGAKYCSGEDSLFIREAFRKGLKIYIVPTVIAKVKQEESSWFTGFNDKYFIDKGVLVANAFPVLKNLFVYYFAFGKRNVSKEYNFFKICKLMKQGVKEYKKI